MSKQDVGKKKKRWGDRRDGYLVRDLEPLNIIMPCMYPNRCDNEAFIQEKIDITNIKTYLAKKNATNPEHPYKIFTVFVAAMVKTMVLRPKMNRFIQGQRTFLRDHLSFSFIIKKQFNDEGKEAIAYISFPEDSTTDLVHKKIMDEIYKGRSDVVDSATNSLTLVSKIPSWLLRLAVRFLNWLDYHGKMPYSLTIGDPSYASVFMSNLGSIKLNAAYHHLTQRGTNSVFVVIGAIHKHPFYDDDGNVTMKECIDIGLTIDERIADGYYYSKTINLLKEILQNPDVLDKPAHEKCEIEK